MAPSVPSLSDDSIAMYLYILLTLPCSPFPSLDPFGRSHPLAFEPTLHCSQHPLPLIVPLLLYHSSSFHRNVYRRHSTDSSSDEYAPTDTETDQYSSSDTELTDVDDNVDEVNLADKVDRSDDIEDVEVAEAIDCAYLPPDEVHSPEYYLKQREELSESVFTT
jgi:hypothetical protein